MAYQNLQGDVGHSKTGLAIDQKKKLRRGASGVEAVQSRHGQAGERPVEQGQGRTGTS